MSGYLLCHSYGSLTSFLKMDGLRLESPSLRAFFRELYTIVNGGFDTSLTLPVDEVKSGKVEKPEQ